MPKYLKAAFLALAGLMLLLFASSSAMANRVQINSTRATTASSTNSQLTVLAAVGPVVARCSSFVVPLNIPAGINPSFSISGVTFGGCLVNGAAANISQTCAWSGRIVSSLLNAARTAATGVLISITVPADCVRITSAGNDFYVGGGTASALAAVPANFRVGTPNPIPLRTLVDVTSIQFSNQLPALGLRVTRVVSSVIGIAPGNAAGFTGLFNFSTPVNGAPIL